MTTEMLETTQKTITVHCKKCNHEWHAPLRLPMPLDRAVTVMQGIVANGCPACGAHGMDVLCGPKVKRPDI